LLAVGAMALLMLGVFRNDEESDLTGWLSIGLILLAGVLVAIQDGERVELFNGSFVVDGFARFMKIVTLIGSAVAIAMSFDYLRDARLFKFEFPVLIVLATLGMMMMISANDLISLYLGLELQS